MPWTASKPTSWALQRQGLSPHQLSGCTALNGYGKNKPCTSGESAHKHSFLAGHINQRLCWSQGLPGAQQGQANYRDSNTFKHRASHMLICSATCSRFPTQQCQAVNREHIPIDFSQITPFPVRADPDPAAPMLFQAGCSSPPHLGAGSPSLARTGGGTSSAEREHWLCAAAAPCGYE